MVHHVKTVIVVLTQHAMLLTVNQFVTVFLALLEHRPTVIVVLMRVQLLRVDRTQSVKWNLEMLLGVLVKTVLSNVPIHSKVVLRRRTLVNLIHAGMELSVIPQEIPLATAREVSTEILIVTVPLQEFSYVDQVRVVPMLIATFKTVERSVNASTALMVVRMTDAGRLSTHAFLLHVGLIPIAEITTAELSVLVKEDTKGIQSVTKDVNQIASKMKTVLILRHVLTINAWIPVHQRVVLMQNVDHKITDLFVTVRMVWKEIRTFVVSQEDNRNQARKICATPLLAVLMPIAKSTEADLCAHVYKDIMEILLSVVNLNVLPALTVQPTENVGISSVSILVQTCAASTHTVLQKVTEPFVSAKSTILETHIRNVLRPAILPHPLQHWLIPVNLIHVGLTQNAELETVRLFALVNLVTSVILADRNV